MERRRAKPFSVHPDLMTKAGEEMTNRIWIEPLRQPDGYPKYSSRSRLYRTKVGDADGPVLCNRTITPTLDSCRALLACGITGRFETWHEGDSFARLTGDIANVAKLEVKEGPVRFVRYEPVGTAESVPQARPDSPPVSDGTRQALLSA
jgi:hypothetical protein